MPNAVIARWTWYVLVALAFAIAAVASRYFALDPALYFPEQRAVYEAHTPWLLLHVTGAVAALLLGPFQFNARLRNRRPSVHRATGRLYLVAVLAGGTGGLALSTVAYGGFSTSAGFALLASSWLACGLIAYRRIRAGDVARHREWMVRCMALTAAGITLRLWLPLLAGALGVAFAEAYATVAWLCWVPNLMAAEWWIHRTGPAARLRAAGPTAAASA